MLAEEGAEIVEIFRVIVQLLEMEVEADIQLQEQLTHHLIKL